MDWYVDIAPINKGCRSCIESTINLYTTGTYANAA